MTRTFQITIPAPTPRRKRQRLSKEAYAAQRSLAKAMIGYDASSPIWGKTVPEVLDMIEAELAPLIPFLQAPPVNGSALEKNIEDALALIGEYRKRIAQNRIAVVGSI